jgi:hypothetical protein
MPSSLRHGHKPSEIHCCFIGRKKKKKNLCYIEPDSKDVHIQTTISLQYCRTKSLKSYRERAGALRACRPKSQEGKH